ncbi:MAG TPA: hypothetical protein VFE05_24245 [Longimicrobiaceae bacterium]|jgi:hypothetical protein|nr:hypothetical protein [Longimicrobiaceae bacterium]
MDPGTGITIMSVTGILTTGGVLIFRPIAKRVGALLDVMIAERMRPRPVAELGQIRDLLTGIDGRLNQLEERQDFAEALISQGEVRRVAPQASVGDPN